MKKLRVAIVADSFYPNFDGLSRFCTLLTRELTNKNIEVAVIGTGNSKLPHYLKSVKLLAMRTKPLFFNNFLGITKNGYNKFEKFLDEFKPDVIHLNGQISNVYFGTLYATTHKVPIVFTFHTDTKGFVEAWAEAKIGMSSRIKRKTINILFKDLIVIVGELLESIAMLLYNLSDLLVVVSPYVRRHVYNSRKREVRIIPNFIDFETKIMFSYKNVKEKIGLPDGKKFLLHVGRLSFEKRIDLLLDIFKNVLDVENDIYLIITSNGPAKESLEKKAKELNIHKNVIFTGFLDDRYINTLYKNCVSFVTASMYDTFNMSAAKSLYFKKPIIAPNSGGVFTYVINGENGFLINYNKNFKNNFADKIIYLLKGNRLPKLEYVSKKFSKLFSIDNVANEYIKSYFYILNKKRVKKDVKLKLASFKLFISFIYYINLIGLGYNTIFKK